MSCPPRCTAGMCSLLGLLFVSNPIPFLLFGLDKGQGNSFCDGYWQRNPAAQLAGRVIFPPFVAYDDKTQQLMIIHIPNAQTRPLHRAHARTSTQAGEHTHAAACARTPTERTVHCCACTGTECTRTPSTLITRFHGRARAHTHTHFHARAHT